MNLKYKKYDNYKPSGVEWLGDVPEHWEVKKLKYLGRIKSGEAIVNQNLSDNGLFEVFGGNGLMGFTNKYNIDNERIIIGRVGAYCGNIRHINEKKWISDNALILSLNKNENYNFCTYALKSANLNKLNTSNAQPLITGSKVMNFKISLPPKAEQNAIANFLDRKTAQIDKAIAQKEQLIELLKERRQVLINEAVTQGLDKSVKVKDSGVEWIGEVPKHWEVKKLRYIAKILRGASPRPSGDPKYFGSNDVNWITVGDITKDNDVYLKSSKEFLTKRGKELSRFLKKGTFVLTNSGATLGVPKILDIDGCINDGVVAFINFDEDNFSKLFIYYYLQSLTNTLRDKMNQGATQPNLNTDIVRNMFVPFTTLENQIEIVNYIETQSQKIKTAILLKQQEIAALKEYKTVLIDAAVTGKVIVD